MISILSADRHWAIGKDNKLLVRIPADMKQFRETTLGKVIVIGRKTLESFPGGQPLDGRVNVVLTGNPCYQAKGAVIAHSEEELLQILSAYPSDKVYVCGGASVYRLLLPYCDTAVVTKIDFAFDADTRFPDLDESPDWTLQTKSEEQTYFDLEYRFLTYKNLHPRPLPKIEDSETSDGEEANGECEISDGEKASGECEISDGEEASGEC